MNSSFSNPPPLQNQLKSDWSHEMASCPQNTASNKVKPWPAYFIVRASGEVVPLIGVDELPIGTELVGVPRELDLKDTVGMLNLGIQRRSEAYYEIHQREAKVFTADVNNTTKLTKLNIAKPKEAETLQPAISKSPTRSISPANNMRTLITHPFQETQTCRHWCTYGHCKWGQQCRYQHRMPMTLPGLHGIGLSDWPSWFRALNPGHFAIEKPHSRRGRARFCTGEDGCCAGRKLGPTPVTHVGAERLRTASKVERQRKESLTEQVIAKLRGSPLKVEKSVSGAVMLERACMKDAKGWGDEGSETEEGTSDKVVKRSSVAKTSLLD